jgi:hypothetical protein
MSKTLKANDGRRRENRKRNFARILYRMAVLRQFYKMKNEGAIN